MEKDLLRQHMLQRLKQLPVTKREEWSQQVAAALLSTAYYQTAQTIATYLSLPHEWDTRYVIEQALRDGKQIVIPKTGKQGQMVFVPYETSRLVQTRFGTWEPETAEQAVDKSEIDWIHVPGLIWNAQGYRIGYGGGFYDRYLSDYSGLTVSTLLSFQEQPFSPQPFDKPVKERIVIDDDLV